MTNPERRFPDVIPIAGELFRFIVKSRTRSAESYVVDLSGFKFNGECDCDAFNFRCYPLLKLGAYPAANLRCFHINRAREYFWEEVGPEIKRHHEANQSNKANKRRAA